MRVQTVGQAGCQIANSCWEVSFKNELELSNAARETPIFSAARICPSLRDGVCESQC